MKISTFTVGKIAAGIVLTAGLIAFTPARVSADVLQPFIREGRRFRRSPGTGQVVLGDRPQEKHNRWRSG